MEIQIIEAIQSIHSNVVLFLSTFISFLASWIGFVFIFITFLLFCSVRYALTFVATGAVVSGVVNIIKIIVKRPRPWMQSEHVLNLLEASGYSMPSGHTATATLIAIFLAFWAYKSIKKVPLKIFVISFCGLFVLFVMFSRMFLGQHFLSDVCAGFGVGAVITTCAIVLYDKYISRLVIKKKTK